MKNIKIISFTVTGVFIVAVGLLTPAYTRANTTQAVPATGIGAKDSVKPYSAVITPDAETSEGFISVHKVKDRYLFEIPDSVMGRDLFTVNRLVKSPQDWRNPLFVLCSYGNDWIGQTMFRIKKEEGNKLVLQVISASERTDSSEDGVYDAMVRNNLAPVYASFPIKAFGKDQRSAVIDMTDYLNSDNSVFGYLAALKALAMPANFAPERSFRSEERRVG